MKWNKIGLVFLFTALVLVGCKQKQSMVSPEKLETTRNIAQRAILAEPRFESMQISKMSMQVVSDRYDFNFKASVKVITDSTISISVLPLLGIEMVRMDFTPRGFLLVDKMNRKYAQGTYDYFKNKWGIILNYEMIESLFSNHIFVAEKYKGELYDQFVDSRNGEGYKLDGKAEVMNMVLSFILSSTYRVENCRLGDESVSMMSIKYSEFKEFDRMLFPSVVSADFNGLKQHAYALFTIDKIVFNNNVAIPAVDLSRYTKVTVSNILP